MYGDKYIECKMFFCIFVINVIDEVKVVMKKIVFMSYKVFLYDFIIFLIFIYDIYVGNVKIEEIFDMYFNVNVKVDIIELFILLSYISGFLEFIINYVIF